MKLIIGLGNPGDKYVKTRHNLGFMLLDEYAKKHLGPKITWLFEKDFKSEIIKISSDIWLIKPQTFMNQSGMAASALANYYKVPVDEVIVIHDDLDLRLGKIKVRQGGAAGGHRGVESIISALNDDKFIRVRLGVGNDKTHAGEHQRISFNAEKFVVEEFMSSEKSPVKHMLKQALLALETILDKGIEVAQNDFN